MQIDLKDVNEVATDEKEELFKSLVATALSGKHTDFELLKNITEWQVIRESKRGLRKVIELFENLAAAVYDEYCELVLKGKQDFNMIYAVTQYRYCAEFYKEELNTTISMTDEYWTYIQAGHFIDQFILLRDREAWDMWDFRKRDNYGTM
jgi:hypothetical protein